jgi:hypothetical protein
VGGVSSITTRRFTPPVVSPGIPETGLPRQHGLFFRTLLLGGGVLRVTNLRLPPPNLCHTLTRKEKHLPPGGLIFPGIRFRVNAIARRHQGIDTRDDDEGNDDRSIDRSIEPDRPSPSPDRERARRAFRDLETVRVRTATDPRWQRRASSSSSSSRRAHGPPFLDALARTSWCVRTERGRSRAREGVDASRPSMRGVGNARARGARGDDARERCGE